ncbi:RDD family protein [Brucella sp. BE17]|uniref:RDD family protein n=1 Tax=Brucella sp. BE17 TaxID=3142977 RepID=UPI0031BB9FA5
MSKVAENTGRIEQFIPPEGVPISFSIASLGSRLGAQLLDLIFTYLVVYVCVLTLFVSGLLPFEAQFILAILLVFFLRIPYYILSEMIWNGRTLGKRIVGIRVINMNGRRLTAHQVTARNLMKEVEFFTPLTMVFAASSLSGWGIAIMLIWVSVIFIVPIANRRRQRLGDMIAGTMVVDNPRSALLSDLALAAPAVVADQAEFDFLPEHLDVYGKFELQTLEDVLRDPAKSADAPEVERIAQTIVRKIRYDAPVKRGRELAFLRAFYRAQREHLETLRLFGNRRENKFHHTISAEKSAG